MPKKQIAIGWSRCKNEPEKWVPFYDKENPLAETHPWPFRVTDDVWDLVTYENYVFKGKQSHGVMDHGRFCELCGHTGLVDQFEIEPLEENDTPGINRTLLVGSCCIRWMDGTEIRALVRQYTRDRRNHALSQLAENEQRSYRYEDRNGFSPRQMVKLFDLFRSRKIEFEPYDFAVMLNSNDDKVELLLDLTESDAEALPLTVKQRARLWLWRDNPPWCVNDETRRRELIETEKRRCIERGMYIGGKRPVSQTEQQLIAARAEPGLVWLRQLADHVDVRDSISRYRTRGEFSPKEMLFIANEFRKAGIRYRPVDFNVSLFMGQIVAMESWQRRKLSKFLKPEQRRKLVS
ncbi:hypothetical protein [Lacipirellula sp.]|uniref:hypothetical protein n=1 Tax=Lacipirellula sp. TaxID=2691419 RepID=UPI003D150DFC